jgi:hypothetical protein
MPTPKEICAWLRANAVGRDEMYEACGLIEKQQTKIERFQDWLKDPKDALVLKVVEMVRVEPTDVMIGLAGDNGETTLRFHIPETEVGRFEFGETFTYKRVS